MLPLQDVWKEHNFFVIFIVYLMFLLDNILLTVVVPIIPDYLFSNILNYTKLEDNTSQRFGPASLSPLQRKYEALEVDNGLVGALFASKAFVQLAFTPLIGYLTGIMNCNIPLLIGSFNMLFAALMFAYGNSYGILVLARALHGSSSAAVAVSGMCILAKTVPKESRSKLMPLSFGGIALGVLIGYPLGGAAYQLLGKSAPFLLIAFFITVSIGLQIMYFEDNANEINAQTVKSNYLDWAKLLNDKKIVISACAICICTSSMAVLEPCVPMWLLARLDPPPSKWQLGAVFIPDSFGYFIGSHFAGLLPIQPWRVSLIGMVLTGLSCCALPLANSISQLALPHFGIGLGVGAVDASLVPFLATYVDNRGSSQYGPVYAFQQASVAIAYSFGPLLAGQAIQIVGFAWLLKIVGFLNLLFCPLLNELESEQEGSGHYLLESSAASTYRSLDSSTPDE